MKLIIILKIILFPFLVIIAQQNNNKTLNEVILKTDSLIIDTTRTNLNNNTHAIYIYTGVKLSESRKYPGTKEGIALGAGFRIPISKVLFLKSGYAFWSAKSKNDQKTESINLTGGNLLIGLLWCFNRSSFSIASGPEISNSMGYTTVGFRLESNFSYTIYNQLNTYIGLSYQDAATLDPGGSGVGFNPLILSLGIEIIL
ncbi:hypothetical protein [Stygiobacter electus]|uniref:Uncharacterized protein n=1 Tax=Stygiobacter electus TaxID=3032292 RepID=A0AAE3TDC1_9BACT|nr:hypothetical protein [Stygiobacter electus]MDF1613318.1 hypothetical protein [Stygiobacter electus]